MKKIIKIIVILASLFILYLVYQHFTYEFSHVGDTKEGSPVLSPNKKYSAQIYYENYGGAAGGINLIVNLINHQKNDEERTIYFSDAKGNVTISWVNSNTLSITNYDEYENRNVELLVEKQIYDEHGGACGAYKIKKEFICISKDSL